MPIPRKCALFLATVFLCHFTSQAASVVDTPYTVAAWQGFRAGALSLTFDDACPGQFTILVPLLDKYPFKVTFYIDLKNRSFTKTPWDNIRQAAAAGHEVTSHSVTHSKFSTLSDAQQEAELKDSRDTILKEIPSQKVLTFAYPNCVLGKDALVARYYMAARSCNEDRIEPADPANLFRINSFSYGGNVTAQTLNGTTDNAISKKGWASFLIHGIDDAGGYNPVKSSMLKTHFDYLQTKQGQVWVAPFADVARYIRERQSLTLKQIRSTKDSIVVKLTDTLPDAIYNVPVTFQRPLPEGWNTCFVSQNGRALKDSLVMVNSKRFVMFDAIPDAGDIVMSTNGVVAMRRTPGGITGKVSLSGVQGELRFSLPPGLAGVLELSLFDSQGVRCAVAQAVRANDGYHVELPKLGAGVYGAKISLNGFAFGEPFMLKLQ
ncbi:MAG: polysaccharide deacetylase family protein [Fibrobacteria bacterium]